MTHDQARERVLEYAYGEMSPSEAAAFEACLREDPALQAELEAVTEVQQAASSLVRPELPPAARGRILQAARSESHRRMMARRWAALQDLFLSPVLLGASAVIAAVGVGLHLILTQGTDDSWTRADREARVAAVSPVEPAPAAPPPAGEPVTPFRQEAIGDATGAKMAEVAAGRPAAALEARGPGAPVTAGARLADGAGKAASRAQAPAKPSPVQAFGNAQGRQMGLGGVGYGGGGAGIDSLGSVAKGIQGRSGGGATSGMVNAPTDFGDGDERKAAPQDEEQAIRKDVATRDADTAKKERGRFAEAASSSAMPPAVASSPAPDAAPSDPAEFVAQARDLRAAGRLPEALVAYRRALAAGPSGALLSDVLAEAAEVAGALGRTTEAEGFLARLERLPGGPARAAKIRAK
jgi:hypothetical protein